MDRTSGEESGYHAILHCPMWRQSGGRLIAMLCTACIGLFASEAGAQCTARDVLQNHLTLKTTRSAITPLIPVKPAFAVPMWRTIKVGTFANSFALLNALDAAGCSIGYSAEGMSRSTGIYRQHYKSNGGAFCGVGRRTRLSDRYCAAGGHFCARSTIRFRACGSRGRSATYNSSILTNRWVSFSSEWSRSKHGRASLSFLAWRMAERDWSSSAEMVGPTQKYLWRPAFCSCGPMKLHWLRRSTAVHERAAIAKFSDRTRPSEQLLTRVAKYKVRSGAPADS